MELLSRLLVYSLLSALSGCHTLDTDNGFVIETARSFIAANLPSRCECIETVPGICRYIKNMKNYSVTMPSSYCNATQIIISLNHKNKNREVCLDPVSKQAKTMIRCWKRFETHPEKRMQCFRKSRCKVRRQKKGKGRKP